jgi:hypothetical protein
MSHAKRGDTTYTRVMSIKMMWLNLGTERYDGSTRIDGTTDIHMEVSHVREFGVTLFKITRSIGVTKKSQIWK